MINSKKFWKDCRTCIYNIKHCNDKKCRDCSNYIEDNGTERCHCGDEIKEKTDHCPYYKEEQHVLHN